MRQRTTPSTLLVLILGLSLAAALFAVQQTRAEEPSDEKPSLAVSEIIAGYKQWTRVNAEPAVVASRIAIACAALPSPADIKLESNNPHRDKFIVVYVNNTGKHAMLQERTPHFPEGSVIVKEKLTNKESTTPELLTVMLKRERGYNPELGDWEFIALDGAGKQVQARGKLENCQACHLREKDTDFVSRNYLPRDLLQKLQ